VYGWLGFVVEQPLHIQLYGIIICKPVDLKKASSNTVIEQISCTTLCTDLCLCHKLF